MKTNKAQAPKPCPYCGFHDIETQSNERVEWEECNVCEAKGPPRPKRGVSAYGWNSRVPTEDSVLLDFLDAWLKKHMPSGGGWLFQIGTNPSESTGLLASYARKAKNVRKALADAVKYHQL